jgi:hypothetical protein
MSITSQSEDQVYSSRVSIKVFHRLWFDNPKRGKAAVSALRAALPLSDARKCAVTSAGPQSALAQDQKSESASGDAREAEEDWGR